MSAGVLNNLRPPCLSASIPLALYFLFSVLQSWEYKCYGNLESSVARRRLPLCCTIPKHLWPLPLNFQSCFLSCVYEKLVPSADHPLRPFPSSLLLSPLFSALLLAGKMRDREMCVLGGTGRRQMEGGGGRG